MIYVCARCALKSFRSFFLRSKCCNTCSVAWIGLQPITSLIRSFQGLNLGFTNTIWKPRNLVGSGKKVRKLEQKGVKKVVPKSRWWLLVLFFFCFCFFNSISLSIRNLSLKIKLSMLSITSTCYNNFENVWWEFEE